MHMMTTLITGSSGLIGSEAVEYFDRQGHRVVGVDNNMRREFFGAPGDTSWNLARLKKATSRFEHSDIDIRDRQGIFALFKEHRFDAILHCAAQPSHDKAKEIPLVDFEVNALGTANVLEAMRQFCPEARLVFLSTNKVYGDAPNEKPLNELATRYDYADPADSYGIDETCRIDRTTHSIFGASKAARAGAGIRKILWTQCGSFSGRLPYGPESLGRGAARLSFLSGKSGDCGRDVYRVRL
jgi:CDP-paratose 2-epimerase